MSEIRVDTISEKTSANGVSIDSLAIKDGKITNLMNATLSAADLGTGVHIKTADSGASAHASADELVIEGSANSGINILSGNSAEGGIYFGDDGDNDIGRIRYDHANNSLDFFTNAAERMSLASNGGVIITTGDNLDTLTLTSTDADGNPGPVLNYYRNSGSAADNDYIGRNIFTFNNDAPEIETALAQNIIMTDVSNGSEDVKYVHEQMTAGSIVDRFSISATEAVFNEASIDADFRVESNGNANMLFVNGGNDRVGIGSGSPESVLHIEESSTPKVTIRSVDGTSASIKLQRQDENDVRTDFELKNDGGVFKIISDNSSINERALVNFESAVVTFNEDSNDIDFVVESDINTHSLIVEGSSGHVGFGVSNPSSVIDVRNGVGERQAFVFMGVNQDTTAMAIMSSYALSSQTATMLQFLDFNGTERGSIKTSGSATAFNTSSDYRLKENVNYDFDATTELKKLKPAKFNWKVDTENTVEGFLAHEVSDIVPDAITGKKDETETKIKVIRDSANQVLGEGIEEEDWVAGKVDGKYPSDSTWQASETKEKYQQIDQSKLVPLMVKTIQELEARIKILEG